jgi:hypothetical protein
VYDTWWAEFCESAEELVTVDEAWLGFTIDRLPGRLRAEHGVPVYCNQWGVKGEWLASRGRLQYAEALLSTLISRNISSSYWIWRSMQKAGRPLEQPVWGFEIVHNNGEEQGLDTDIIALLAASFAVGSAAPPSLPQLPPPQLPPPPSQPLTSAPLPPLPAAPALWVAPLASPLPPPMSPPLPSIAHAGGRDWAGTALLHTGTATAATAGLTQSQAWLVVGVVSSVAFLAAACVSSYAVARRRTGRPASRPRRAQPAQRQAGAWRPRRAAKYTQLDAGRDGSELSPHMAPREFGRLAAPCCTSWRSTPPGGGAEEAGASVDPSCHALHLDGECRLLESQKCGNNITRL